MSTSLQVSSLQEGPQSDGRIWYQLHSEKEEICEALLQKCWPSDQYRGVLGENRSVDQLQARLRLVVDALDRLMAGSYGNCVTCRRRIKDNKLNADPVLPYCHDCERNYANQDQRPSVGAQWCAKDEQ